jgi:branched-chain amino acid transport system substrate-binding protein
MLGLSVLRLRDRRWSLAASMLATVLAALTAGAAQAADPIVVGAHIPLTGPSSELGQGFDYGARLAFQEINAHGGVNGHELKLIETDDASTPNGAITAVQRLTLGQNILLLWNGSSSSPTVAVVPRMRSGPMPYYVSFASDPRVLDPFSKYVWSGAALPVASIAADMVDFLATHLKAQTVALLSCDQANCKASVPLLRKGLEAKGVKIVADQTFHSGDTDFTGQISAIKDAKPDVVQIWGLPADGGRIVGQLRRAGVTATIVGDTAMTDQAVLELAGPAAEGMYAMWIAGAQFLSDDTGPMKEFRARFAKAFPNAPAGMPNQYTIRAYADAYVIAEALRRAGTNLTQDNIVTQLDTIRDFVGGRDPNFTYATAIGLPRSFSPTDHQGTKTLAPVVVKDGKFHTIGNE